MSVPIHLPVFQRFDCHGCTDCCRVPTVFLSDAEHQRILAAGWPERMKGETLFVRDRRLGSRHRPWRITKRADGACVFLGADDRCRLHAETGIETKPLACRMYPFAPVPGVDGVRIDLRADCPSVAANRGRTLAVHQAEITRLIGEIGVRGGTSEIPPFGDSEPLTVFEFDALVSAFDGILRKGSEPIRMRLKAGCCLLDLLYQARLAKIRDERFVELLHLLATAAWDQAATPGAPALKERSARLFRQWVFLHGLYAEAEDLEAGRLGRRWRSWRRYLQARRFARGFGPVPKAGANWPDTGFHAVQSVRPGPDETLEPLCRIMRLKLDAHAFAGPAYFGYDLRAGLTALWLMAAAVGWYARLAAVAAGRDELAGEDVLAGLRRTHHTFGTSAVFRRVSERLRLRALASPGVPGAILARYGP